MLRFGSVTILNMVFMGGCKQGMTEKPSEFIQNESAATLQLLQGDSKTVERTKCVKEKTQLPEQMLAIGISV